MEEGDYYPAPLEIEQKKNPVRSQIWISSHVQTPTNLRTEQKLFVIQIKSNLSPTLRHY